MSLTAPLHTTGGITTWTRTVLDSSTMVDWTCFDTTRHAPMGNRKGPRVRIAEAKQDLTRGIAIMRAWRSGAYDVAYLTCPPSIGFAVRDLPLVLAASAMHLPVIIHLHGGDVDGFFGTGLRLWFVRHSIKRASLTIVITRDVEEFIVQHFDVPQLINLPNPLPDSVVDEALRARPDPPADKTLIHVGWQAPAKGSLCAIRAMQFLPDDYSLRLIGQVDERNRELIEQTASVSGVRERVTLVGNVDPDRVRAEMLSASVLLLPAWRHEGQPLVVAEAMARGLPIVATPVGAIREMIASEGSPAAGRIVDAGASAAEPARPEDVANAVLDLATSPAAWLAASDAGRARAAALRASRLVPELERHIQEIAAGREPAPEPITSADGHFPAR